MSRSLAQATSMRDVTKALKSAGWTERHNQKHHVFYCPCGNHIVTLPGSGAKKGNAFKNYVGHVKRTHCPSLEEE